MATRLVPIKRRKAEGGERGGRRRRKRRKGGSEGSVQISAGLASSIGRREASRSAVDLAKSDVTKTLCMGGEGGEELGWDGGRERGREGEKERNENLLASALSFRGFQAASRLGRG